MKTFNIICDRKILGQFLCELVNNKWHVRSGHISGNQNGKLEYVQVS
jgi:hypothetical protein